jgi:hypothetical protein
MSVFAKLFGPAPAAPAQAAQIPSQPGQLPANAAAAVASTTSAGTGTNGVVPATPATTEGVVKSGLDGFSDIWNTEANKGDPGQPLFNVSHDKMMEAARKQNFTAGINPDLAAKIAAGGTEAVAAMMEMMNTVAQNAYAQSAFAGTRLIEGALEKSQFAKSADIDNRIRSTALNSTLQQDNPMLSHPAAQPILNSIQQTLLVKFPNATAQELAGMAKSYLTEFATAANGPANTAAAANTQTGPKETDWSKW